MRLVVLTLASVVLAPPILARADLARCKDVRKQAARAGIVPASKPAVLVRQLSNRKALRADLAYCRLVKLGPRAIAPLLDNTGATVPFAGAAWVNPSSSVLVERPSTGLVSLYLVEAILTGASGERRLAPHLVPRLTRDGVKDQQALLAAAAEAYQRWWATHATTPLADLRAAGLHPLRDSPIDWL